MKKSNQQIELPGRPLKQLTSEDELVKNKRIRDDQSVTNQSSRSIPYRKKPT